MPLLQTTTAEGAELGMILARAPHELKEHEVAYLQDVLVNNAGLLNRRGAIQGATALTNIATRRPAAITGCYDPLGNYRIMVLYWRLVGAPNNVGLAGAVFDSSFAFLGVGLASAVPVNGFKSSPPQAAGLVAHCTPSIDGGVLISAAAGYGPTAWQSVTHWWGGYGPSISDTIMSTVTLTTTSESVTVTGGTVEIAKLRPGVVIYKVGVVKSVDSTTQVTLLSPNPDNATGTFTFNYGMVAHVSVCRTRGKISCAAGGSGTGTVTGYGTRWKDTNNYNDASPSFWVMRDPKDGTVIAASAGTAADLPSDTVAQYATPVKNRSLAPYEMWQYGSAAGNTIPGATPFMEPRASDSHGDKQYLKGFITFSFKGYQFYVNSCEDWKQQLSLTGAAKSTSRGWIAGPTRHNSFDHSPDDGDWFDVVSSGTGDPSVYAGVAGANAAVICKGRETHAIRGDTPDDFNIQKIADDGALTINAIARWEGNVIWLGRDGIWMYDGVNAPRNIVVDTMGQEWVRRLAAFQTENPALDTDGYPLNQAHCFVFRNHLFVNITNTGNTHSVYIDGVAYAQNPMQLMIYLPTNAMSFLTNFNFSGFIPGWPPDRQQEGYTLLSQAGSTTHYLFPMSKFFTQGVAATDAFLTANSYKAPDIANANETYIVHWAGRDNSASTVDAHGQGGMALGNPTIAPAAAGPAATGILCGGGWDVNENGHVAADLPGAGIDCSFIYSAPSDPHLWFFGLGNAASVGVKTTTLRAKSSYVGVTGGGTATSYGSMGATSPNSGDLMSLFIAVGENATLSAYAALTAQGFTLRYSDTSPKSNGFTGYLFTKVCTGTEGSNYQPAQVTLSASVCWGQSSAILGTPSSTYVYPIDDGNASYDTEHVASTNGFKYYSTRHGYSSIPTGVAGSIGPWFHMESRKYDAGDGLWKKSWKQLAIEFMETNSKKLLLETVAGLNTTGVRAATPFSGTGLFLAARVKFRTRNQYMGFKLYEDINNRPSTLIVGAWQLAFKLARRGAV